MTRPLKNNLSLLETSILETQLRFSRLEAMIEKEVSLLNSEVEDLRNAIIAMHSARSKVES